MSHYISSAEITDRVIAEFVTKGDARLETWMTRVDKAVDFVGQSLGVDPDDFIWWADDDAIDMTLMHPMVMEYARAYFCLLVCEDNIGAASNNPAQDDLYLVKMKIYQDKVKDLRQQLNSAMFWEGDEDLAQSQTAGAGGTLFRG